jgi:hypothetical protein
MWSSFDFGLSHRSSSMPGPSRSDCKHVQPFSPFTRRIKKQNSSVDQRTTALLLEIQQGTILQYTPRAFLIISIVGAA